MDIKKRIKTAEQKFETERTKREQYLKQAEDSLTEMTKLQGEWRVLQDMLPRQGEREPIEKAGTIEVIPEVIK